MKKISKWLKELPEEHRDKALTNFENDMVDDDPIDSLINALYSAFSWSNSPEGFDYWRAVKNSIS